MKKLYALALALVCSLGLQASHIYGGEIYWECQSSTGTYELTLVLYRDCAGITLPATDQLSLTSSCGTLNVTVALASTEEVSGLCPSQLPNSSCNGGPLPGVEMYTYTATVPIPPCADWTIAWETCCRPGAIVNLDTPTSQSMYIEANMDNVLAPCDDSPVFGPVVPFACIGQPTTVLFSANDADADSLSYMLVSASGAVGAPLAYVPPYTAQQPIVGLTWSPTTGAVQFTPTTTGAYVIVMEVTSWNANGVIIGTVQRDIMILVTACTGSAPDASSGTITNFIGSAIQTGTNSISACPGDDLCFDVVITDPDAQDSLFVVSNVLQVLSGASFNFSGVNPITCSICWTAPPQSSGLHAFQITASDNACPVQGSNSFLYAIQVSTSITASEDGITCGGQAVQLSTTGGPFSLWSVVSGDPIQLGVNFSCNLCQSPLASPSVTTTYAVSGTGGGGCTSSDTVTVFVVPDFTITNTPSDTSLCWTALPQPVPLSAAVDPPGTNYSYAWESFGLLNDGSVPDPLATVVGIGTYAPVLTVTSSDGCVKRDTVLIEVEDCMTVDLGSCGMPACACSGPGQGLTLGTGLLVGSTTDYPSPFGNWYEGARHQMLYRASELHALGFGGGRISSLAFNISAINGSIQYFDWVVKMGCIDSDELVQGWDTSLVDVFSRDTLIIQSGWNTFSIPQGFHWDGISNILVEVCFNNDPHLPTYTLNSPVTMTETSFNSVRYFRADNNPNVCGDDGLSTTLSTTRPDMRIVRCLDVPLPTLSTSGDTLCMNTMVSLTASTLGDVDGYLWDLPADWTLLSGDSTATIEALVGAPGAVEVAVSGWNPCGTGPASTFPFFVDICTGLQESTHPGTGPKAWPIPVRHGQVLEIPGVPASSVRGIIGMDGRTWPVIPEQHNGNARVNIDALPAGAYVVRTDLGGVRFLVAE